MSKSRSLRKTVVFIVAIAMMLQLLVFMPPMAFAVTTIVEDSFTNTSSSWNYTDIPGTAPFVTNLPGGNWIKAAGWSWGIPFKASTATGEVLANACNMEENKTGLAISLMSSGTYVKPTKFEISAEIMLIGGTTGAAGAALGFYSSVPAADTGTGEFNNFTGLKLTENGSLTLYQNGTAGTVITGPAISRNTFYTLSYTVDTATGAISNVSLEGSTSNYNFSTTAFTDAATSYGAFIISGGGNTRGGMDNFKVSDVSDGDIPHSQMSVTATSEQNSAAEVALASYAIDDDPDTFWHSQWDPTRAALPQSITLDLGSTYSIQALRYLPRQDGNLNGTIARYYIYVSTDGTNFIQAATGTWALDATEKVAFISDLSARYVKLTVTEGVVNVASAAEINIEKSGYIVNVTGISLSPTTANVAGFGTTQLTATVYPSNARNKTVNWTSSNPFVATVSSNGLVAANNIGSAVITATTQEGGFTATCNITVSQVPLTGISISPASTTVQVNETKQLTATMTPINATNKVVNWSSSNSSIATVSSFGVIQGISAGTATITATTMDGNKTSTCSVNVVQTSGTGVLAVKAVDFLNSLGVQTHMSQGVDNPTQVANALVYTGIRNFRDDFSTTRVQDFIDIHNQTGARMSLLPKSGDVALTISVAEQLAAAGALLAVEGKNEPNNFPATYEGQTSGYTTTFMPMARFQRDLYAAVRANTNLDGIPVFNSSEAGGSEPDNVGLQFNTIPAGVNTLMPDGTQYGDYANIHNYICRTDELLDNMAWLNADSDYIWWADGIYAEYGETWHMGFEGYGQADRALIPKVTTETGWNSTVDGAGNTLTQDEQGRLYLNMYLSQFKRGFTHTFFYMMKDDSSQDIGKAWGLYDSNWNPKPVANYIHNFTTILADTGSISPGRLNYSIPNQPTLVHDLLIQKSNGKFYLAVWSEQVSGTNNVTVNLGSTYGTVKVYTPRLGTSPTQTLSNVSSVNLTLDKYDVVIIEL